MIDGTFTRAFTHDQLEPRIFLLCLSFPFVPLFLGRSVLRLGFQSGVYVGCFFLGFRCVWFDSFFRFNLSFSFSVIDGSGRDNAGTGVWDLVVRGGLRFVTMLSQISTNLLYLCELLVYLTRLQCCVGDGGEQ